MWDAHPNSSQKRKKLIVPRNALFTRRYKYTIHMMLKEHNDSPAREGEIESRHESQSDNQMYVFLSLFSFLLLTTYVIVFNTKHREIIERTNEDQFQLPQSPKSVSNVMMALIMLIAVVSIVLVGCSLSSQRTKIDRLSSDLDIAIDRAIDSEKELLDQIERAEEIVITGQRAQERVQLLETKCADLIKERNVLRDQAEQYQQEMNFLMEENTSLKDQVMELVKERDEHFVKKELFEAEKVQRTKQRDQQQRERVAAEQQINSLRHKLQLADDQKERQKVVIEEMTERNQHQMDFLHQEWKRTENELHALRAGNNALITQGVQMKQREMALAKERDDLRIVIEGQGPQNQMGILDGKYRKENANLRTENEYLKERLLEQGDDEVIKGLTTSIIPRKQDGPNCWKYAAATWIRGLKRTWFLSTQMPDHGKIVESFQTQDVEFTTDFVIPKISARARNDGFLVQEPMEGHDVHNFVTVRRELLRGYPVIFKMEPSTWRIVKMYIHMFVVELIEEPVLNLEVWGEKYPRRNQCKKGKEYTTHMMVLSKFIPGDEETGERGMYVIKNSHGEEGGSPGQKGFILIDQEVFEKRMEVTMWVAQPTYAGPAPGVPKEVGK